MQLDEKKAVGAKMKENTERDVPKTPKVQLHEIFENRHANSKDTQRTEKDSMEYPAA